MKEKNASLMRDLPDSELSKLKELDPSFLEYLGKNNLR